MRRGRLMLLTLLAFALPTAAFAKSVKDYDTGTFLSGTITGTFNTSIVVTEVGTLGKITINTGSLNKMPASMCPSGSTCYDFTGGSVTVDQGGHMVFNDSLSGGFTIKDGSEGGILATLVPGGGVGVGTAVATLDFKGHKITTGSSDVSFSPAAVPEPSSLLSLGTGLIGLAGMMRRKLRI